MATKKAANRSKAKKLSRGKKMTGVKTLTTIPVPYQKVMTTDSTVAPSSILFYKE